MTRDVIIKIKSFQSGGDLGEDETEVITTGVFLEKGDRCFVKYEERMEGFDRTSQNLLKFDEKSFSVTKKGLTNVQMIFEKGRMYRTGYGTPFGSMSVGIETRKIKLRRWPEEIRLEAEYGLEVNCEHLADCRIIIKILPSGTKETHLLS